MKLNFSSVPKMSFEPVPVDMYEVTVQKVTPGTAASGYSKLDLQLSISESGDYENRKLFATISTHPNALWKFYEVLTAFGYTEEDLEGDEEGDIEFDPQDLIDAGCYVDVSIDEYQGKQKNRVDKFRSYEEIEGASGTNGEGVVIEEDSDFYSDPEEAFPVSESKETINLNSDASNIVSPAARKLLTEYIVENNMDVDVEMFIDGIEGTGKNGLITKKDAVEFVESWN